MSSLGLGGEVGDMGAISDSRSSACSCISLLGTIRFFLLKGADWLGAMEFFMF